MDGCAGGVEEELGVPWRADLKKILEGFHRTVSRLWPSGKSKRLGGGEVTDVYDEGRRRVSRPRDTEIAMTGI